MFRSTRIFLQSFPLAIIVWKVYCKIFSRKIPQLSLWQEKFRDQKGIEIGGPSGMFNTGGYLPIYNVAASIDGVNFSNATVWEGDLTEGHTYKYFNKTGYQFIAEGSNLNKIQNEIYEFVLSCNNLEHMANPLAAIFEWKRILKMGGVILLILPKKQANFDHRRPDTTIQHLIYDYNNKTGEEDRTHLNEILELHDIRRDPQAKSYENFKKRSNDNFINRCMHHHVFSQNLLTEAVTFCGLKVIYQFSSPSDHFIMVQKN